MNPNTTRMRWLKDMYPGYFTLTMATGIISLGMGLLDFPKLAMGMYAITMLSWAVLFVIYMGRIVRFPGAVWSDVINPRKTFNFFSFVAGTSVAGLLLHFHGHDSLALLCWAVAFVAWLALLYFSFGVLTLVHGERNLKIVDGGWLICIVGTQSLVLLGLQIFPLLGDFAPAMMLLLLTLWGLGLVLYGIFVTLFCYRIFFNEMAFEDYTPQMWVIMGAAAISTNASSAIEMAEPNLSILYEIHPVIEAMALITWAWATWWIPLLLLISYWKHITHRIPISYDPRQWSIVFPLGMYTVASIQLSLAVEIDPLHWISHVMIWVALGVWCLLIVALLRRITLWFFTKRVDTVDQG